LLQGFDERLLHDLFGQINVPRPQKCA
jgi:hypothetical protein